MRQDAPPPLMGSVTVLLYPLRWFPRAARVRRPPAAQRRLTVWPIWLVLTLAACSVHLPHDTFQAKSAVVMGGRPPSHWHSPRGKCHAGSNAGFANSALYYNSLVSQG